MPGDPLSLRSVLASQRLPANAPASQPAVPENLVQPGALLLAPPPNGAPPILAGQNPPRRILSESTRNALEEHLVSSYVLPQSAGKNFRAALKAPFKAFWNWAFRKNTASPASEVSTGASALSSGAKTAGRLPRLAGTIGEEIVDHLGNHDRVSLEALKITDNVGEVIGAGEHAFGLGRNIKELWDRSSDKKKLLLLENKSQILHNLKMIREPLRDAVQDWGRPEVNSEGVLKASQTKKRILEILDPPGGDFAKNLAEEIYSNLPYQNPYINLPRANSDIIREEIPEQIPPSSWDYLDKTLLNFADQNCQDPEALERTRQLAVGYAKPQLRRVLEIGLQQIQSGDAPDQKKDKLVASLTPPGGPVAHQLAEDIIGQLPDVELPSADNVIRSLKSLVASLTDAVAVNIEFRTELFLKDQFKGSHSENTAKRLTEVVMVHLRTQKFFSSENPPNLDSLFDQDDLKNKITESNKRTLEPLQTLEESFLSDPEALKWLDQLAEHKFEKAHDPPPAGTHDELRKELAKLDYQKYTLSSGLRPKDKLWVADRVANSTRYLAGLTNVGASIAKTAEAAGAATVVSDVGLVSGPLNIAAGGFSTHRAIKAGQESKKAKLAQERLGQKIQTRIQNSVEKKADLRTLLLEQKRRAEKSTKVEKSAERTSQALQATDYFLRGFLWIGTIAAVAAPALLLVGIIATTAALVLGGIGAGIALGAAYAKIKRDAAAANKMAGLQALYQETNKQPNGLIDSIRSELEAKKGGNSDPHTKKSATHALKILDDIIGSEKYESLVGERTTALGREGSPDRRLAYSQKQLLEILTYKLVVRNSRTLANAYLDTVRNEGSRMDSESMKFLQEEMGWKADDMRLLLELLSTDRNSGVEFFCKVNKFPTPKLLPKP